MPTKWELPRKDSVDRAIEACKGTPPAWKQSESKREEDALAVRGGIPAFEIHTGARQNIYECMSKSQLLTLFLEDLPVELEVLLRGTEYTKYSREAALRALDKGELVHVALCVQDQLLTFQEKLHASMLDGDDEQEVDAADAGDIENDEDEGDDFVETGIKTNFTEIPGPSACLATRTLDAERGIRVVTCEDAHRVAARFFPK